MNFAHIAILVDDVERMEAFYRDLFELHTTWSKLGEKAYLTSRGDDIFALLGRNNAIESKKLSLSEITKTPGMTPNFFHFGPVVQTDWEFDALLERVRARGLAVAGPKVSRDGTRSFYFHDPEGNCVQVTKVPPRR